MISELSGLAASFFTDRTQGTHPAGAVTQDDQAAPQEQPPVVVDSVSLSAEALELANRVAPPGESAAQGETGAQDGGQQPAEQNVPRFLDITA